MDVAFFSPGVRGAAFITAGMPDTSVKAGGGERRGRERRGERGGSLQGEAVKFHPLHPFNSADEDVSVSLHRPMAVWGSLTHTHTGVPLPHPSDLSRVRYFHVKLLFFQTSPWKRSSLHKCS